MFKWLLKAPRIVPRWIDHGGRDIRCAVCGVPRQAHTRELHEFKKPEKEPR